MRMIIHSLPLTMKRMFRCSDAVVVDVDGNDGILDAVMLDDVPVDGTDFITLSDDSVVMPDSDDVSDFISIDVDGSDISFIL